MDFWCPSQGRALACQVKSLLRSAALWRTRWRYIQTPTLTLSPNLFSWRMCAFVPCISSFWHRGKSKKVFRTEGGEGRWGLVSTPPCVFFVCVLAVNHLFCWRSVVWLVFSLGLTPWTLNLYHVSYGLVLTCLVLSCLVLSCLVLSCLVLALFKEQSKGKAIMSTSIWTETVRAAVWFASPSCPTPWTSKQARTPAPSPPLPPSSLTHYQTRTRTAFPGQCYPRDTRTTHAHGMNSRSIISIMAVAP